MNSLKMLIPVLLQFGIRVNAPGGCNNVVCCKPTGGHQTKTPQRRCTLVALVVHQRTPCTVLGGRLDLQAAQGGQSAERRIRPKPVWAPRSAPDPDAASKGCPPPAPKHHQAPPGLFKKSFRNEIIPLLRSIILLPECTLYMCTCIATINFEMKPHVSRWCTHRGNEVPWQ